MIAANGSYQESFDYYPFGLQMPQRSTTITGTMEQFTGKERDTEGDLNQDYFGARYYDAAIGRWSSVDPKADKYPSWSTYNYTLNNPVSAFDPDGRYVVKGSKVTRVSITQARIQGITSLAPVVGAVDVFFKKFRGDPSYRASTVDQVTLGLSAGLKASRTIISGVANIDSKSFKALKNMTKLTNMKMSSLDAIAGTFGDFFAGDVQALARDEAIFSAASSLTDGNGNQLGELSSHGTEFNVFESVIEKTFDGDMEEVENYLENQFLDLRNYANKVIDNMGLDLSNDRHLRLLKRKLEREVSSWNED